MNRRVVIIKAILALAVVWGGVWAVRSYAGSKKVTAETVKQEIEGSSFADLSTENASAGAAIAKAREEKIREVAEQINRLDFQEREKNRNNQAAEEFFRRMSTREKDLFLELTVMKSMGKFMEALDAMPPDQRKRFVEQGLKEIEAGRTEGDMLRAQEMGDDVLQKITQEGMKAYFQNWSAQTKLDLAPLMQAMNEVMQGIRGNELGMPRP